MGTRIRVGTRGSALAMRQTEEIVALLRKQDAGLTCEIVEIATHGDRFQETPIAQLGDHVDIGIFNSALEQALLGGEVDLATCSFKDVESALPRGLKAVSVGAREDFHDVLVSRHNEPLDRLPRGAVLATSSPRRIGQLAAFRADFRFEPLRGNVTTRVERDRERYDGVVLAAAGLRRLGLQHRIVQTIPEEVLLPAPAQGAMGCEFAAERTDIARRVAAIQDADTELCVRMEKALLVRLSGGCFAPVGILATLHGERIDMRCRIASLDGTRKVEERVSGAKASAADLEALLAQRVEAAGGKELVEAARAALRQG
ncbi:MAG: hydroxymethylbilane synthase [SAR324 cluster bacterium]